MCVPRMVHHRQSFRQLSPSKRETPTDRNTVSLLVQCAVGAVQTRRGTSAGLVVRGLSACGGLCEGPGAMGISVQEPKFPVVDRSPSIGYTGASLPYGRWMIIIVLVLCIACTRRIYSCGQACFHAGFGQDLLDCASHRCCARKWFNRGTGLAP